MQDVFPVFFIARIYTRINSNINKGVVVSVALEPRIMADQLFDNP